MCQGRCAGCGQVGPHRALEWHVMDCPEWLALFRDSPEDALAPSQEYERWAGAGKDTAGRKDAAVADTTARREAMAERFTTRDILDGE